MEKFLALSQEKQQTIIQAAMQCFGKYGYDKASVNDIAVAAHISKASIFQYFGSKKQLYVFLLEHCMKTVMPAFDQRALDGEKDLLDRILLSSRIKTAVLTAHPYMPQFLSSVWEEASPEVGELLETMKQEAGRFRSDMVLREGDAEKFKDPADASAVYQMLLLMAEGYTARYRNAPSFDFDLVMQDFEKNVAILKKNFYKKEYL
ncbi:MAG: TetR/AcrR family transcriptional regulator [Eubacteriales bacterium]|nr:TetR/AcrR family transcriptional regulator [Eubacteriales bacterium]